MFAASPVGTQPADLPTAQDRAKPKAVVKLRECAAARDRYAILGRANAGHL
jgi:hypothetical protein